MFGFSTQKVTWERAPVAWSWRMSGPFWAHSPAAAEVPCVRQTTTVLPVTLTV